MSFKPGDVVRLKHDPARVGTLTKHTRFISSEQHWYVQFPSGFEWVPENQLEQAADPKDPLDLLVGGTLSPASDLRRVLTHARLSGRLQDVIYSLFTTCTDFYPHQFKPVLQLLTGISDGILIADEVGLGKTIEAGLIWTELRTRFEYQRLFVLCPAVLCKKWQMELRNRFGIKADIVNAAEAFERLHTASASGLNEGFALIGSMQGLRPPKEWRLLASPKKSHVKLANFLDQRSHEQPLIDMLVIDEAHHMRNTETATSDLGHLFRAVASHVVLLSATPVNLDSDDLFSLMQLVDPDTFANGWEFQDILRANGPLVAARERVLKSSLSSVQFVELMREAQSHPILEASQTLSWLIEHPPTDDQLATPRTRAELAHQLDQVNLLGQVVNRTRKRNVHEHQIIRNAVAQAVVLSDIEAEFYRRVTEGVREYCERNGSAVGFMLTTPQRLMASSIPAAFRHWKEALDTSGADLSGTLEDEDDARVTSDDPEEASSEIGALVRELTSRVQSLGNYAELKNADSKYRRLKEALLTYFEELRDGKVVLFTSFRATLRYLDERLREDDMSTSVMHGDTNDKDSVIDAFREHVGPMVLLSSEVGSEGVDLQFARLVINYDLPWNPMRVEQRIGRLDRLGQRADSIAIWNLFCADTIDQRIHDRLYLRIGIFEHALGGLEPILGVPIERLTRNLLMDTLTPEQEAERIEATAIAIENNRKNVELLEENAAQFFALGDYLLERVRDAQRLGRHIQAEDLRNYVVGFLRVYHPDTEMQGDPVDPLALRLRLKPASKVALEGFLSKHRLGRATRLTLNSGSPVACRFENTVMETDQQGEELISQFHPLVRYARERLSEDESDLRLAIAARISASNLQEPVSPGHYAFAIERWSVTGVQEIERLAYELAKLGVDESIDEDTAESLVNRIASKGEDWPEAASDVDLSESGHAAEACLQRLNERYASFERTVRLQNEDRASALLASLERQVEGQANRIEAVNEGLRASGRHALVAANEGRIKKLRERAEMRRIEIANRTRIRSRRTLFLMGVIEIQD